MIMTNGHHSFNILPAIKTPSAHGVAIGTHGLGKMYSYAYSDPINICAS